MNEEKRQKEQEWLEELRRDEEGLEIEREREEDGPPPTRADLEAACAGLRRSRDILGRFVATLVETGKFAGSTAIVTLLFLALCTRHLAKPVSVAVRGESSAGKSYAIERALDFVSPGAVHVLSSMSEKALVYSDEEFAHRMIVLYEADSLANKNTAMLVRVLLSEGRVVHEYTDFDGGRRTVKLEKDGPTGLITSAAGRIDYELATRLFSVNVDDGPEATRAIMASLALAAEGRASEADFGEFHALDLLIAGGECRVVIPFAGRISDASDASATRLRRDFRSVLGLVEAHALLHQDHRERDHEGRIVAQVEDYAAVHALVADLLAYSSGQAVPTPIRETVEAVAHLQFHGKGGVGEPVKLAEIAAYLGIHRTTATRRVNGAIKLDLLKEVEAQRGGPRQIKVGEPLPEDRGVLPSPDDLDLDS